MLTGYMLQTTWGGGHIFTTAQQAHTITQLHIFLDDQKQHNYTMNYKIKFLVH